MSSPRLPSPIEAQVQTLQQQRNAALDSVAQLTGSLAAQEATIAALQEQVAQQAERIKQAAALLGQLNPTAGDDG